MTTGAVHPGSNAERKLGLLLNIAKTLGGEIHLDSMLPTMIAEVSKAMGAERTSLFLYDENRDQLFTKVAEGVQTMEIRVANGVGIVGMTAQNRAPINIPDAYQDPRFNRDSDKRLGFVTRSILTAPILSQENRLLGVVEVLNKQDGAGFTAEDETFLAAIGTHLALALERAETVKAYVEAEKMRQALHLAHDIQLGLLPKKFPAFPNRPEVDLFATLTPALDVGGDLYDFFLLDEHRVCFVIGDVSDKGVPAALFMAMVRTAFKISAMANSGSVASTFERVNEFLCENNDSQMFVTVFGGILDVRTGLIEYSDGGHEPPFLLRQSGHIEMLEKKGGIALGFLPEYTFPTGYIQLNAGDTILLYTDGVNEAFDLQNQMFRTSGIEKSLARYQQGALAVKIVQDLADSVKVFVGSAPQSDDITILALRYCAAPALTQS